VALATEGMSLSLSLKASVFCLSLDPSSIGIILDLVTCDIHSVAGNNRCKMTSFFLQLVTQNRAMCRN